MGLLKQLKRDSDGFTLVEILVVLVILSILAAVSVPSMIGFVNEARGKAYIAEARVVYVAAQAAATEAAAARPKDMEGEITFTESDTSSSKRAVDMDVATLIANHVEALADGSLTEGSEYTVTIVDGKIKKVIYRVDNYDITIEPGKETTVKKTSGK